MRTKNSYPLNAGIALGPILFIIAILAVLAAAIAAGSGSFNASTGSEGNKAKASALIQIGSNLKVGMDRLTMENQVAYNGWTINSSNTSNTVDLYSPSGGGISAPSIGMAGNPGTPGGNNGDVWYYPQTAIPQIGSYSGNSQNTSQIAVLNVSAGVCAEINSRANGQNIAPNPLNVGNFATAASSGNIASVTSLNWPSINNATSLNLYGRAVGCINNNATGSIGYFFYQVLYIQ